MKSILAGFCFLFAFVANNADGVVTYWDPTGATASATPNGNWEDAAWSTSNALTPTPVNFVDSTAAGFSAGTAATGTFTVSLNTTQNVAGIFNGLTASIGTVTISGSGALNVPAGQQGFYTASPGSTIINVPIMGPCQVVLERTGQFYFNGTNSYSGGTQLGFSTAAFTGTVNINNSASFGTGPITMFSSGCNIALTGTSPVTIPNSFIAAAVSLNITGNAAGLTFSGPWNMAATPNLGSGLAGAQVIISGVMSGAGGLNKYNPGILKLTAINTYTGSTTISNGTLALGSSGSINNSASLALWPGANGTIFDVSAIPAYTLGGSTTLIAQGAGTATATAANIKGASGGTISLGARPVNLTFKPTVFTGDTAHSSLFISQGALTLNNNTITITNAAATALGIGTYRLIQVGNGTTGVISGAPKATVSVVGTGVAAGLTATLVVANGNVNLVVKPPAVFSGFSLSQSNVLGVGAVSVTVSGKVSAGAVYPAKNETVNITINGGVHPNSINDTTGDFSFTFTPGSVPYAATNSFVFGYAGNASLAGATNTTLLPGHGFYLCDALPGFFSGMNLFFTNAAGISMSTWSTTNLGQPVTDWTFEAAMGEQPLNDGSGNSRYSLNVNPTSSPMNYICGPSLAWPYLSPATVNSLTTDSDGNYTFYTTNTPITPAGVLGLPAPPVIVKQPVSQTILSGKNANFNVTVTGSQPLAYQWYFNTNTELTGSQSNSLTVLNPTDSNVGSYSVITTNLYGSTTSLVAALTLVPPPQVTGQPVTNGFQLVGQTIPGNMFEVQVSTNLTAWTSIATNVVDTNGFALFIDTNAFSKPARFYRLFFP